MMNDIETLLKTASLCADDSTIAFLLAGSGKERENLEAMALQLRLQNVIFTGALPKSQMPELLAASDACVAILRNAPYLNTTYPNKVFDYMAAGRAVVLGIDGVIRDVVEAARCGVFVMPGDADALASAIKRMKSDPASARTMGMAGRAYVVEHFHRDQHAAQFVEIVRTMRSSA
jgi:glycosyltransferase involved in cell wall biosynthesis